MGYEIEGKGLEENNQEMDIIQIVKKNGKLTLRGIADLLNEKGIKGKRGGKFYPSTIAYIRQNEIYATFRR